MGRIIESSEDLAARLASAWGKKRCPSCNAPAAGIIRSLAQESELKQQNPGLVMALIAARRTIDPLAPPQLPTFPSKYGPLVIIAEITPCARCFQAAERAAAKHPSWVLVEIEQPHAKRIVGSVPVQLEAKKATH